MSSELVHGIEVGPAKRIVEGSPLGPFGVALDTGFPLAWTQGEASFMGRTRTPAVGRIS